MRLTFTYYYVLYSEMLTKCTIKMLYGRYEERSFKPNSAPDNGFKCFSDERVWLKTLLIFYKANIIQQASLTKNIRAVCW